MKLPLLLHKRIPFWLRLLLFILILHFTGVLAPLLKGDITVTLTMPGGSHQGALPPLTAAEEDAKQRLHEHIKQLTVSIGERNISHYDNLEKSAAYIADSFRAAGYEVRYQNYTISGKTARNIEVLLTGSREPEEILVIGAHYDSVHTVAANDNGSGVAALLELARLLRNSRPATTIRFVAFTNEEPPYFQTNNMGSFVYAKRSYEKGENIRAMLSLETIGYYSDVPESQHYPFPLNYFYPDTGNFIGFVGNARSKALVQRTVQLFRKNTKFPSEGAALTEYIRGVGWSDQWSFWQFNYPALMVTDTATYRYPFYHSKEDTIDKIDFAKMARVVVGLEKTIRDLATE